MAITMKMAIISSIITMVIIMKMITMTHTQAISQDLVITTILITTMITITIHTGDGTGDGQYIQDGIVAITTVGVIHTMDITAGVMEATGDIHHGTAVTIMVTGMDITTDSTTDTGMVAVMEAITTDTQIMFLETHTMDLEVQLVTMAHHLAQEYQTIILEL